MARIASGILTHGDLAADQITRHFGLARLRRAAGDRLRVIRLPAAVEAHPADAVESRMRVLPESPPEELVLLFFGSVKEYRGVPELISAFERVARPGIRLVIRGATKDATLARSIGRAAARCEQIDFEDGFVPEEQVASWMAAADIIVAPYRRILTSGSVSLAMASARPCLAPRIGTIPEYLNEDCGFLYDPDGPAGTEAALEKAMVVAIDSRATLRERGDRARSRVLAFRWKDAAREHAAFYRLLRPES